MEGVGGSSRIRNRLFTSRGVDSECLFAASFVHFNAALSVLGLDQCLNLRNICSELSQVAHNWFKIGIQLGVPRHKLKEFEKDSDPLSAVVDYWLKGNVEDVLISWKSVMKALECVEEKGLAKMISKKYCESLTPEHVQCQSTVSLEETKVNNIIFILYRLITALVIDNQFFLALTQ